MMISKAEVERRKILLNVLQGDASNDGLRLGLEGLFAQGRARLPYVEVRKEKPDYSHVTFKLEISR